MKQTTLTQRLLSALVALCMVLSVCAPALAAEASAAVITLTKNGKTTGLTPDNVAEALPQCTMSVNGSKVTLDLSSNTDRNLLSDAVLTAVNSGTDLELVCGYEYVTAIENPVVITGMHDITLSGYGMAGSLKIENCNGKVSLTAQHNRAVLGSLNINNTAGTGGVTITGSHQYPLCNYEGGNTEIASNGPVKIENKFAFLTGRGTLVGPAVQGSLIVTHSSSVEVTGTSGNDATIIGNADITSYGAVTITNAQGTAVGGKLTVNAGGAVTVTGDTVDATKAAIAKGANIMAGGSVNISNPHGIAVDGGLTVNNTSGDVTVTSKGEYALKGITTITSNGAVNITSNGGQVSNENLTVNKSSGVTVTAVSDEEAFFYRSTPRFVNTPKVEIWNKGTDGWVGTVEYVPPAGMGSIYYTSSASNAEKTHTHGTGDSYHTVKAYFRIESAALYTLLTEPEDVTAKTNDISDNRFYAGETVTVTAPADTETKKFESWTLSGKTPSDLSGHWETKTPLTFTMPAGNVTLTAKCKTAYALTVDGGTIVNGTNTGNYLPGTKVTVTAPADTDTKKFEKWTFSGTEPTGLPDGWQNSKEFTFKMPAGNVTLTADYMQLYNLTVTGGTIVNGTNTGNYLPGTEVTVAFTGSTGIEDQFEKWTGGENIIKADPADWQSKPSFSFTMPAGNVTLKAECKTVYNVSVADSRGTVLVNNEERSRALEGETVTVKASDTFFDAYHEFDGWKFTSGTEPTGLPDGWQTSKEFTFKMPAGNVTLKADYKQLYDLTVTGGTIVDGNGDTGIYLPGTEVTIQFTESDDIAKQFKQWKSTDTEPAAPDGGWPDGGWQNSPDFTFKMPEGNVSLRAEYRETYQIFETAGRAEFFAEGAEEQRIYEALPGTRIIAKVPDSELNDYCQFNMWQLASEKELVKPDQNWQGKQSFCFTMPEGYVELRAYFTTLYDVNVTHGTIVDGTGDTGTSQKIVKPGQLVTVRAESTEENPFLRWNSTGKAPVEPDDGWQTSPEFTFKMPEGNVTLEAQRDQLYKVSINDSLGSVTINGKQRSSLWVKEGDTVTVATTLKDGYWMEFEKWNSTGTAPEEPEGGWTETNKSTSTTFTFKMPNGPVELVAQWSASSLDPKHPIDPDEPLDEDFGVEPAPMDTTGGTIAAVAVGGAAIWGGYEIATRVILHRLLPEGAAIPANRGQLALLVWNTAGRPEPAGVPAFADVTDPDMAKAAQWCTEQGTMAAKGDRFEPEGWTPKFKVIEVWNKAFPAA